VESACGTPDAREATATDSDTTAAVTIDARRQPKLKKDQAEKMKK
jgi:hypothetical protein